MKKLFIILLLLLVFGCSKPLEFELKQITINKDNGIHGSFFLGCSQLYQSSDVYYYFYTKSPSGIIKLRKILYSYMSIIEDNSISPKAVIECTPWTDHDNIEHSMSSYVNWCVYIPENSIIENYDVNLKLGGK